MDVVSLGDPSAYRGLGLCSLGMLVCCLVAGGLKLTGRWSDTEGVPSLRWWHVILGTVFSGWGVAYFYAQVLAIGSGPDAIELRYLSPRPSVQVSYAALRSLAVIRVEPPSGTPVRILELATDSRSFRSMEGQRDSVLQVVDRLRSAGTTAIEWRRRDASGNVQPAAEAELRAP